MKKLRVIISGGGTGGHIYPAVAVAQALQKRLPDVELLFVGASDRMEMEKVPKAGYKITGLWISGLQRSLSIKNLLFPLKLVSSILKSFQIIKEFKPDVAIGFGGYASGALMYAAGIKKIPSLIHEQNSYAGITNKILKNRVDSICVAYDNMDKFFPQNKIVYTGNPIRQDLVNLTQKRQQAFAHFKLDAHKKTVLIIGGSLGARTINQSIDVGLNRILQAGIQVIWQTGKLYDTSHHENKIGIYITSFIYEMDLAYAAADVVISRAGALSIAELACVRKPIVLVPSPNVAEDHQTKNAMALVQRDAAILVKDADAKTTLVDTLLQLIDNHTKQAQLKDNISSFCTPNAAQKIVDEILTLIKQR
jgi:UDP-N-acetylglucosamine--N-acetylmuramyl-(pentapeptide) pyrophosphoryl-undecaprenol N-acetylglucosamine transferase